MQMGGFINAIITPISSQLTHLKPTSQVVHLKCTLKVSILLRTSLSSLFSQNPFPSCSGNTSPSPVSQYNNSILPHSFPTERISPATTCSGENIDTQVYVE